MQTDTAALPPTTPLPSPLRDWLTAARPRQWAKNLVVFAGLLFTGNAAHPHELLAALAGFAVFCLFSSVGYLINDVLDADKDRAHPVKCRRPIAAGRIRPATAITAAALLSLLGFAASWALSPRFALVALVYLLLSLTYSVVWKHQVILDLLAITGGFLLRALAGTTLVEVNLSAWLFVCLLLLALLVGLGKRLHEFTLLEGNGHVHRPVLAEYSRPFLDHALSMAAAAVIVSYSVYCISSPTAALHPWLVLTVPVVLYSLLRYMYLVLHCRQGGQPEDIFLTDRPIQVAILLWVAMIVGIFLWG